MLLCTIPLLHLLVLRELRSIMLPNCVNLDMVVLNDLFIFSLVTLFHYWLFITAGDVHLKEPHVVTCHVLSSDTLTALSTSLYNKNIEETDSLGSSMSEGKGSSSANGYEVSSLVLVGLHACGDLSVSMLRFVSTIIWLFKNGFEL